MVNDTSTPSGALERDSISNTDSFFNADEQDSVFDAVQLAQADGAAPAAPVAAASGAPQTVTIPEGANVVRVAVTPGEVLELPAPFTGEADLLGRVGDGNLAIKVGDVTVILQGYVDANQQAPVTVETADGQPIDVATMLAATDPTLDIQTAAGPGDAAGAQGADNNGAIFAQFGPGGGLGGFAAIGALDATELNYGLIDNSIRQELADEIPVAATTTPFTFSASGPLGPMNEAFLRHPANSTPWSSYQEFASHYFTEGQANWADFFGTMSEASDYLDSLHRQADVTTSASPATVLLSGIGNIVDLTSNGSSLHVTMTDGNEAAFIYRDSDGALVAVVHVTVDPADPTTFHIDTYLINRLDDLDANGDPTDATSLDVDFNVYAGEVAVDPEQEGQLPAGGLPGTAVFDITDDAPLMDPANPNPDTVGEGEKANSIGGSFNFDFGADGPLDALIGGDGNSSQVSLLSAITTAVDLSLKVSDPDDGNTVYLQFENGALLVSNLTSGGSPVDVVQTHDSGHTILTGSIDGGATPVFVITVTDATGAWTFELEAGLDHPDAGETGALDQFQFDLGAHILDDDKDAASGSETFFVNDSGPTVVPPPPPGDDQEPAAYGPGTLVYESALADGSDPSATTETTVGTVTIAAADGVSAITVAGVSVDLGNVANTPVIHGTYGDLTITGWNPATGALDYSYTLLNNDPNHSDASGNDIVQGEDFAVVATDGDGDTATADIAISIVDDIPHAVDDALDTVLVDGSAQTVGNILTNDGNGADPDNAAKTISDVAGGTATATGWDIVQADGSGTVHVAPDGTVTFTANPGHDFTTPDTITFDYTIIDADGDTSTATARFSAAVRGTPLPESLCLAVDESQLPDGSQGGGGPLTDTQVLTLPDGFTVDPADLGTHSLPNGILTITQVGQDVTYAYTLNAAVDDGTPNLSDDRNVVDGADTGNTFALHVTGPFGQTGIIGIDVTIEDDVPTAKDDTDSVDNVPNTATGNVISGADTTTNPAGADIEGADGATVTKLVGAFTMDTDNSNGLVAVGAHGTLTMSADGSYIYTRSDSAPLTATDTFQYTLTDKDGDASPATLTISIDDQGVHITNLTSSTDGGDTSVDEDDLGARGPGESLGSDGSQSTIQDGDFTINAPDGVKDLTIDGHAVITNGVFAATSFTTGLGNTLAITGYNESTGKISYTYTLLDNETHADGSGQNSLFESFSVVLTDIDNDSDTATLSVKIVDDIPTAANDSKTVSSGGTATGNVEANDVFGADGPSGGGVVGVTQGSNTGVPVLTGTGVELVGTYGKLTLQANGSYQYVANPNTAGIDHFVYTIKDADGDLSTAKLDITVNAVVLETETQTVTVNEAALDTSLDSGDVAASTVTGSNPGSPDETTTGHLNLDPGISTTPGDYPGTYGTLRIDSLGNYTYTLTTNPLVAGAGTNVIPGETFLIPIQDALGNTGTDTIKVNVIDDVPSNFDPQDQSLLNGTAGGVITGALNIAGHTGADGLGSIVFSGGSDGSKAMLADGTTPLTCGGKDVLLSGFGTGTLTGFVDANNDGKYQAGTDTAVFKVTLDGAGDTYTFQLFKDLDDGQRLDFTDLSGVQPGNNAWIGVDSNAADANSGDLLFTAKDFGSGDAQQVNRSNVGISIDDNNGIGAGQGVRLDFVKGLTGSPSTINGFNFSGHYQVQDFQFTMIKVQGNASATTSVKLTAMDVTNPANGGGTTEAAFLAGAIVGLTAGEVKVFHGTTDITASVTFTYNPDGTVVVGNLHEGDIIKIHETTGFDRISIDSTGGTDFLIANALVTETVSGRDMDLKFGTTLADGDGDTSAGNYIGINLQTDDGQSHTFNGGSGADTMVGGSGNDYIFGNAGNDTMLYDSKDTYDGGAGFDRLLVTTGGHTIDFDGAKYLGIEMVDLGDTNDRSGAGNQNNLVLDAGDVVGSNAGTVAGHQISFFVIGDTTGSADDRDNVQMTGFGAVVASGSAVDAATGVSHTYNVYESSANPAIKVAIEQGLDVT